MATSYKAAQFHLRIDDLHTFGRRTAHRGHQVLLGYFVAAALDHDRQIACARVDEVDVGLLTLGVRRVDHKPPIDAADADSADRPHEGDVGKE